MIKIDKHDIIKIKYIRFNPVNPVKKFFAKTRAELAEVKARIL